MAAAGTVQEGLEIKRTNYFLHTVDESVVEITATFHVYTVSCTFIFFPKGVLMNLGLRSVNEITVFLTSVYALHTEYIHQLAGV